MTPDQRRRPDSAALTRRAAIRRAATGLGGLALSGSLLSACARSNATVSSGASGATTSLTPGGTLRIGFVSPISGPDMAFGEPDGYVLGLARKAFANGLATGGRQYAVEILSRDSRSDPTLAAEVAGELIHTDAVDLMLAASTAATVNPVANAAEAAGIPCVSTSVPWEAWMRGRGVKLDDASPFTFTFHFGFGGEQLGGVYSTLWPQVDTNRKVGVLWSVATESAAVHDAVRPLLEKAGYTILDPGSHADAPSTFSTQITRFKSQGCDIVWAIERTPELHAFLDQAAALEYRPAIVQTVEGALFASQAELLGAAASNLASACFWHPTWPYSSPLLGLSSTDLTAGYEASGVDRPWNQQLGPSAALFDVAAAAFAASGHPKDRAAVAATLRSLSVETPVGTLTWGSGPNENVAASPIVGSQWVRDAAGALDLVICENSADPGVPVAATLQAYT